MMKSVDEVSKNDVRNAIGRLAPKHTQGPDGVSQFVDKDCCEVFVKPLRYIHNLSIRSSLYQGRWKISKVIPIHNGGSKNYRTTGLFPFSQCLQKHLKLCSTWPQHIHYVDGFVMNSTVFATTINFTQPVEFNNFDWV